MLKKSGPPLGIKRSETTKILISKKTKGQKRSNKTIQAMKDAWKDPEKHKNVNNKVEPTPEEVEETLRLKELRRIQVSIERKQRKSHLGHHHNEGAKKAISVKTTLYKVQNLETGEIFPNTTAVDTYYRGKHTGNTYNACRDLNKNIDRSAYGYHWVRLPKDSLELSEEEREKILNTLKLKRG